MKMYRKQKNHYMVTRNNKTKAQNRRGYYWRSTRNEPSSTMAMPSKRLVAAATTARPAPDACAYVVPVGCGAWAAVLGVVWAAGPVRRWGVWVSIPALSRCRVGGVR